MQSEWMPMTQQPHPQGHADEGVACDNKRGESEVGEHWVMYTLTKRKHQGWNHHANEMTS